MQVYYFSEFPYHEYPEAESEKYPGRGRYAWWGCRPPKGIAFS